MNAKLERRSPNRQGVDAGGRRVFLGAAGVRLDGGADLSVRAWCLGAEGGLLWWLADDDVPSGSSLVFNPRRTEVLIGSGDEFIRVEAATGSIRERGLKTDLHGFGFFADGTLLGMDGPRLVRRSFSGEPRPTWAPRRGISGLLDRLVEPWLSRSDSIPALLVDGRAPTLVAAPDRVIRLGDSAWTFAGPDGEVHLVQAGVTWLRLDERGTVLHRIEVSVDSTSDEAVLDAKGRLWIRAMRGDRNVIVCIDPKVDTARVVASSQRAEVVEGFAVDLDGELRLPTNKKVDTPDGDEAKVPLVKRRSGFRPVAIGALLTLALVDVAVVPVLFTNRTALLNQAASGEPLKVQAGRTGHQMLQSEDLQALAPGQLAYAIEVIVLALGLLLLTAVARTSPVRAVKLASAWVTAVAVVALVVNTAVTLRPMGGFDTFALAGVPAAVHLGTWMALLFLLAFGGRRIK